MERTLKDVMAGLPEKRCRSIEARTEELCRAADEGANRTVEARRRFAARFPRTMKGLAIGDSLIVGTKKGTTPKP